jgi:acyl CoA:acetate/3-ketoacid CoA transferase beta subunit
MALPVKPWMVGFWLSVALFWGWSCHERSVGRYKERIAVLEHDQKVVDTIYQTKTKVLTQIRRHTDSVITTDTVLRVDTVRILLNAERKACDQVIQTCEQRVAIRDSIIRQLKKKPSVFSHLPWVLGGIVAGKLLLK